VERGERNVTLATVEKIALALNVDAFDLLAQAKQAPTETILEINLLLAQQDKFGQQKALNILKEVSKTPE
jgi:transcriptional regulator with XRE-family HTH domain